MSRRRILLVGFGRIGKEVFEEWRKATDVELMVVDLAVAAPSGHRWEGEPVDVAVVMVDTPASDSRLSAFEYGSLRRAIESSLAVADFVVVRSTVAPDFLDLDVYRLHRDRIGFSPEFYGATVHSARSVLEMDFVIVSDSVPDWFAEWMAAGRRVLRASAGEVAVAKLAENAYLATKVTFFHELALVCSELGLSFDAVRELVTSDPRIGPGHSYCDAGYGWSSHCFDKDVPVFADLGAGSWLLDAVIEVNKRLLSHRSQPAPIGP